MPMDRSRYPADWESIAFKVKEAANWQCQKCDRPCKKPNEGWYDLELRLLDEAPHLVPTVRIVPRRFMLTVSHTNHDPENLNANLKALCSVCHCRYDLSQMPRKRQLALEKRGQLKLNL